MGVPRRTRLSLVRAAVLALLLLLVAPAAQAHPLSRGSLDVTVHPDRVAVRTRVTLEEVSITNMLVPPDPADASSAPATSLAADAMAAAYRQHALYLSRHVHVSLDAQPTVASVQRVIPPEEAPAEQAKAQQDQLVVYELEYRPASSGAAPAGAPPPRRCELRQDVLAGVDYAPGIKWEASYVVRIRRDGGPVTEGLLLTSRAPVGFTCDWGEAAGAAPAAAAKWRMAKDYFVEGVHHILSGYDHLLFVGALVLAATTFWDLVKVVTAFTLAHTLTLTLSALNVVRLPAGIVEPLIAASIVFVAVQNVFWPSRSRGWLRLAAAFFFGLFHGLGFAGGLLEAMQGMAGVTVLLAIAAFSVGVEVGHQVVVLPLFASLKLARRSQPEEDRRERLSLLAQRYGSAMISIAGLYFLVHAVRTSFAGS